MLFLADEAAVAAGPGAGSARDPVTTDPWVAAPAVPPAAATATAATPKETFLGCNAIKMPLGGSCVVRLQSILQMIFLKAPRKSLEKAA